MQVAPHTESWPNLLYVAAVGAVSLHCLHECYLCSRLPGQASTIWVGPFHHCHSNEGQPTASLAMQGVREIIAQARKARCPDAHQLYVALVKAGAAATSPADARLDAGCLPCHSCHVTLDLDKYLPHYHLLTTFRYNAHCSASLPAHPSLFCRDVLLKEMPAAGVEPKQAHWLALAQIHAVRTPAILLVRSCCGPLCCVF